MINYYSKFLHNLSTELHSLYNLLHHSSVCKWGSKWETAYKLAKSMLSGDNLLIHYGPMKPVILRVDARPYGLGAVLSHKLEDGSERPVAYASRTLSVDKKNYAQTAREGLVIIFAIKKFQLYLFCRKFSLVIDHQPPTCIFCPQHGIPPLASERMQRWALILAGFDYEIVYRTSMENANADLLSRLPVQQTEVDSDKRHGINTLVDSLPVTAKMIAKATEKDSF